LNDGTQLSERNDTVRGTPENPMSRDEIIMKARDLITPVLGSETCTTLVEQIYRLEQLKNVRDLRPLLQRS
jgi:2-methylcitrate dehydratase PrpD